MKDLPPPRDPIEAMGEAYELLLEKALHSARQGGAGLHEMTDVIRHDMGALSKYSEDELARLERYVKRDLIDAASYLNETGKELNDWLGFDLALIKSDLWQRFAAAADKTTTALLEIKLKAEISEYHTGEIIGLGTLVCDQCGETLHFHKPGHIPPCPRCKSAHFHRQHLE